MTQPPPVAVIEHLATEGYAVVEGYFDPILCHDLQLEAEALASDPTAIDAGIGRGAGHYHAGGIRRARILWLDAGTPAQVAFMAAAEVLRLALNRQLFLGLLDFEAQLALTPVGGFYARHLDGFQGRRNRVVSLIAYLNEDWQREDGGCLRIWPLNDADPRRNSSCTISGSIDVMPARTTLVLMLSETVSHEVLVSLRPRASIAGWFSGRM